MRLRTRLLLALTYVLLLAVISLGLPLALSLRSRVDAEVRSQAESQADLVAATASDLLAPSQRGRLDRLVSTAAADVRGRVIVVDADGRVLADSAGSGRGASYGTRPEIASALGGRRSQIRRHSDSLGTDLLATAVPILGSGRTAGAVRVTQGVDEVGRAVRRITIELALLAALVLALGMAAGLLIARSVARPIVRLEDAARRVADGDLSVRVPTDEGSAEQRSLARSFNEMTARLSRALDRQREFVADASHQLRTPLTGVRLRVEEAQALGVSPAAAHELDGAEAEVDRMAQLVDELLLLSRAGEHELPAGRLVLGDVAARAAERWTPVAAAAGLELTAVAGDAAPAAWAPAAELDRALDSLVENAVRYASPATAVEIAALAGAIEVRDRGPGIDPAERELVWERFHRGRAGRQASGGTGLGLPIARELARGWGGEATLRPRPGGGAIARLDVPPAAPDPGRRPSPGRRRSPATAPPEVPA
ncbi:sensor histidine kinase [Capillimicrobium parvum]|uniref:histidine kinase n=1 Tax=Capillimicrobium parvum TaxID=2884022 RepID=A0A9E6XUM8_9ACTN|nr:ATP-binding protein [Capillimicrobium parvum]UGS34418.1 Adaptive-response sensory-kinase SasA [Capillimicrobium parvum]